MKYFLKGAAALGIVMIVNIIINVLCNRYKVELNSAVITMVSTFCAIALYHILISNEENKNDQ